MRRFSLTPSEASDYCRRTMKRQYGSTIVAVVALTLAVLPLRAQESDADLRRDIDQLKRGQQQILQQLQQIQRLVQARGAAPAAPNVRGKVFDLGDNPIKGAATAKLTLVEFTDYQ